MMLTCPALNEDDLSDRARDSLSSDGLDAPSSPAQQVVPLKVVFQCLHNSLFLSQRHLSFRNVISVLVNLDTMVSRYIADFDLLWHLAKVLVESAPALASPAYVLQ